MGAEGSPGRPSTATLIPSGHAARQVMRASWPAPAMPTSYRAAPRSPWRFGVALGRATDTPGRYQGLPPEPGPVAWYDSWP